MEIIVEIGTDEEKQLIAQELQIIESIIAERNPPINLLQIIVASEFQSKINALEGIDTYRAKRGLEMNINAIARIAKLNNGYAIVLSPILYSNSHDSITRLYVLLHELSHVIHKQYFSPKPEESFVKATYLHNLDFLYDEYSSDRFAYRIIDNLFPTKSSFWDAFITDEIQGFLELLTNRKYYDAIRKEINSFRDHANVDVFLNNIHGYCDDIVISLAHVFSLLHQYPNNVSTLDLLKSPFVNEKTFALMDYFRLKEEKHDSDLSDGIDLIADFETNLGVKFEPMGEKAYCHVLDI